MPRPRTKKISESEFLLLEDLLNTRAAAHRKDGLASAKTAGEFLCDAGLLPMDFELSEAQRERLVKLREGLSALLLAPASRWDERAAHRLRQTIQAAALEVFVNRRRELVIDSSALTFEGALGKVVSLLVKGYYAGHWNRFKTCANPECLKVFFDDSRNRAREWCHKRCGDLVRQRAYRRTDRYKRPYRG